MFYEVIPIRVFREDAAILTYSSDQPLKPGHIVEIPLGKSKTFGIVTKKATSQPDFKTKSITRLLYKQPLPKHILKSILWLSKYYLIPLPQAAKLFLPQGIGKNRRNSLRLQKELPPLQYRNQCQNQRQYQNQLSPPQNLAQTSKILLNPAQKQALKAIESIATPTKLLHGVTGSGKTNIYLKLAENTLKQQKSVVLLVPEIALTSQLVQIFQNEFTQSVILIHSRQTEAERHLIWEKILNNSDDSTISNSNEAIVKKPQIIIGPRSALLAPINNLGLIIIDEAHEPTYVQENAPKYSTLRLASFIAKAQNISCIYGTATPLVSDYYLATTKNSVITLKQKAKDTAKKPDFHITDLKNRQNFTKNRYFSDELLEKITENLKNHHQTLIFHNRRGSAPLTICENCGWQALCPNCFLPLTLHSDSYKLICHTCGHNENVPSSCPDCKHPSIIHKGFGTKLLESELKKLFKSAKIARFDADNTKFDSLDAQFNNVKNGDFDIIIGTQTIAKGLDLPLLATVGIVQADAGLSLPDFASEERTFHLLTQVIGRVGRGHLDAADVYIQTFKPDHPVIHAAIQEKYQNFYQYVLNRRKNGHFPPFYYLAKLSLTYKTEATTLKYIKSYQTFFTKNYTNQLLISNPTPSFHEHTSRGYTWQLTLRARSRAALLEAIQSAPKNSNLSIFLDPPSLL